MQTFQLQEAWQRTISDYDKEKLTALFEETKPLEKDTLTCVPYRLAYNHREELLCTVLIHNTFTQPVDIGQASVKLLHQHEEVANYDFHFSQQLTEKTSMPWTYIFPKTSYAPSLSVDSVLNIEVKFSAHTIRT